MEAKVSEEADKLLLKRLFWKVSERTSMGGGFDDKEMLHELEQSLA
jgi:hypothetical protein